MLIDSHCHLPASIKLTKDILDSANNEGINRVINIGTDLATNLSGISLAEAFDQVYTSIGIYPHNHQGQEYQEVINKLEEQLALSNKIVAIGECGIDISAWQNQTPLDKQIELFEMQIILAQKHNLPIIIHCRNGHNEVLNLINKYSSVNFVAHCFDAPWDIATKYLDLGVAISFSGFVTYTRKTYLLEVVEKVPDKMYILETDAPYILPKGIKHADGLQNEPKNVKMIAQKVAMTKKLPFEDICSQTYLNTCALFKI